MCLLHGHCGTRKFRRGTFSRVTFHRGEFCVEIFSTFQKILGSLLLGDSRTLPSPPLPAETTTSWAAMESVPETYVQKLPRRAWNVKKLPRRDRNVTKLSRRVRNVNLVDLVGYRELGSLKKSWFASIAQACGNSWIDPQLSFLRGGGAFKNPRLGISR